MSEYRISINHGDETMAVMASGSKTLLEVIRSSDVEIHAPCGGNGTCARCRVEVWGKVRSFEGAVSVLDGESILACRYYPDGELTVVTNAGENARIVADRRDIAPGGSGLGLAVDIGTTTVAAYLYDLESGKCLNTASAMNAQRGYGSDVISRIQYASNPKGLERLSQVIRRQIVSLAESMCGDISRLSRFSIAANTVMEHIFAGISPESIGVAPFTPLSLFGKEHPARDFFTGAAEVASLYLCPAVAGYVGGDITAGLLSSGAYDSEKTVLFIDIGTNGEMALGSKKGFVCCATAAGPAFEGAEIECGSPACDGAINTVSKNLEISVIGQKAPASICGSGIIDAVSAVLYNEIIDETGRMDEEKYILGGNVYISGKDVRQIQLAKAAIRAGIETLLSATGESYEDIAEVLIAGGFGAYMSTQSACAIGLLPPAFLGKTRHTGNSAGAGAAMALSQASRDALSSVAYGCRYVELSSSPMFNDKYIDAMMFDEWEEVFDD